MQGRRFISKVALKKKRTSSFEDPKAPRNFARRTEEITKFAREFAENSKAPRNFARRIKEIAKFAREFARWATRFSRLKEIAKVSRKLARTAKKTKELSSAFSTKEIFKISMSTSEFARPRPTNFTWKQGRSSRRITRVENDLEGLPKVPATLKSSGFA